MGVMVFVFIETSQEKTWDVARQLRGLSQIKEVHCVSGPYDIIARIEVASLRELADVLTANVYSIPGVKRTLSNIVVD